MEYEYDVGPNDSFYNSINMHYFLYNNLIIAFYRYHENEFIIKTFDLITHKFGKDERLYQVNYDELQDVSYLYEKGNCIIVIDMVNKRYAQSCKYNHLIHELDGNIITSCRDRNRYYIFHSHTESYNTGVFLFNIENNTINNEDFINNNLQISAGAAGEDQLEISNIFASLHNKDVDSCCVYNRELLLIVEEKICSYDVETDHLVELLDAPNIYDMKVYSHYLIAENRDRNFDIYDIETKLYIKSINPCVYGQYCIFWDFYDGKLVVIRRQQDLKISILIYNLNL